MSISTRTRVPATEAENVTQGVIRIFGEGRVFYLRKPITLNTYRDEGMFVVEYEPLNVRAAAESQPDALRAFADQFAGVWAWLVEDESAPLHPSAKAIQKRLLSLVQRVEDV